MDSPVSPEQPPIVSPQFKSEVEKIGLQRGKLETLTSLLGYQTLKAHQSETQKNREAESKWARQKVWGASPDQSGVEDVADNTILGDVNYPTPIVVNGNNSGGGIGQTLATLALGSLLGGGGIVAGMLLNKTPDVIEKIETKIPGDPSEKVSIGLGQFEDYFPGVSP